MKGSASSSKNGEVEATTEELGEFDGSSTHIFSDPKVAERWRKIYEEAKYENRHRFDPSFTWSPEEERRLVRKIDFRITLWAWVMFLALDFHRKNISRAISDNMLAEIGMNTNDFNYGQTIFLFVFLAAELPSGLISKKLGADIWIPFIICAWSVIAGCQAALQSKAGFYVIKVLLGLFMGGFIPDAILWLTYFFRSNELPLRLAFFWTGLGACSIIGSLLAAGLLQLRGVLGLAGWRWLFLIEGTLTLIVGLFSWVLMPPGPCQTKNWFRGKDGWFTEREEYIMVNRLLRDDPSKGDMNNRQAVNFSRFWKTLSDWEIWPLYLIGFTAYIPPSPLSTYVSYILRQLGFSVFHANLLVIPSQFLFLVNLLIITWLSQRFKERSILSSLSNIWMLPFLVGLLTLRATASTWIRYALITGVLSYPYCHAIVAAWNARNSNSVRTRAVSAALYNMFVQGGNIVSANIFRDDDKPLYRRGNKILVAIAVFNIILFYAVKAFYIWRNKVRERRWNELTEEQQQDYLANTTDDGHQRLDFRFGH